MAQPRRCLRWMAKWPLGAISLLGLLAMVLNACGMFVSVFGAYNTVTVYAGLVRVHQPEGGENSRLPDLFDQRLRQPRVRVEWLDPVWKHGQWGWWPRQSSGSFPGIRLVGTGRFAQTDIPLWPVVLIAGAASGWVWIGDVRRSRRRRAGACVKCGYDLRGLGDGRRDAAICPECGHPQGS